MLVSMLVQKACSTIAAITDSEELPLDLVSTKTWVVSGNHLIHLLHNLNLLQNIRKTELPYLVTLNPPRIPDHTLLKWSTGHPVPSVAASKASIELDLIQGKRGIWFCGAYQGNPSIVGKKISIEHLLELQFISHICWSVKHIDIKLQLSRFNFKNTRKWNLY